MKSPARCGSLREGGREDARAGRRLFRRDVPVFQAVRFAPLPWVLLAAAAWAGEEAGNLWKSEAPNQRWLAAARRVADTNMIWKEELDGTKVVVCKLAPPPGKRVDEFHFAHVIPGRVVARIAWSPDSGYVVFTTTSSGGHSPWHFSAFVVDVAARKIIHVDSAAGPVVSADFQMKPPHTAVFKVGPSTKDGIDFEHPVSKSVDLARLSGAPETKK